MNGLVIWACSYCRSTLGLYRELIRQLNVPAEIALWKCGENAGRTAVGFCATEFDDLPIVDVGENLEKGLALLNAHPDWNHLFCVCQGSTVFRRLIVEAKRRGCNVGVMCESPCNMDEGFRRVLKKIYLRIVLPRKMRKVVAAADFFANCSGDDFVGPMRLGWVRNKILPFGYFPPPIEEAKCVKREVGKNPFLILATGVMSKYRGVDVIVDALRQLKERNVDYRAVITQKGELFTRVTRVAQRYGLPIEFPGFVPMKQLVKLYESCSLYVAGGRDEPWGMRLNDALQCGAPLAVSRGMGGVQLVDRYGCGIAFARGNAKDLANQLERVIRNKTYYQQIAENAYAAAQRVSPGNKAAELIAMIDERFPAWTKGGNKGE